VTDVPTLPDVGEMLLIAGAANKDVVAKTITEKTTATKTRRIYVLQGHFKG